MIAKTQRDRVPQRADANARTLKIDENTDVLPQSCSNRSYQVHPRAPLGGFTVRTIDAHDIDAGLDHLGYHTLTRRGRPLGGHVLGAPNSCPP